jgi:multiple sugar transport system substrate-binding protein
VNITFTIFDDGVNVDRNLVEEFNRTHPDIQVTYQPVPSSELKDRLTTWLATGDDSLDVIGVDVVWPSQFAKTGWIRSLDEFMDEDMKKAFTDGTFLAGPVDVVTVNGQIVAIPWNSTAGMLYYRKDLLEAEGLPLPRTWDELIAVAEQVAQKYGMSGYVGQYKQFEGLVCNILEMMKSHGGNFLDENGNVVFHSEENKKALETLLRLKTVMPEGVVSYQEKESQETFLNGGAVFLRTWNSFWANVEAEDSPLKGKVGVTTLPAGENGTPASTLGGWNLAISAYSKYPKEAFTFIKWLADAEQQKVKALEGGRLPTLAALYEDEEIISANPTIRDFYQVLQYGVSRPKTANYGEVSELIQDEIMRFYMGQKSVDQTLADLHASLEEAVR